LLNDQLRRQAFRKVLEEALLQIDFDPVKASTIASQIGPILSEKDLANELVRKGVDETDAYQLAQAVIKASTLQDATFNPLGAFLLQRLGTNTELAAFFKLQTINLLTPGIGAKKASEVAEEYAALIFTSPDSVVNLLRENERNVRRLETFNTDARLFEDYRDASEFYRNPSLASESPLRLGKTLLLTGLAGGLSMQGVVSTDDTLGPLANRTKHATNYPGILG
jgi:hypothetical protein